MGTVFSSGSGSSKPSGRIIMLGLDAAGKTTLLYKMRCGEVTTSIPTIGFNIETVSINKRTDLLAWDVGGRSPMRPLWRHYLQDIQGVVFVVDSADGERLQQASDELAKLMSEDQLAKCPLVLIGNKKDLPNAVTLTQLADVMKLRQLQSQRPCAAFSTCAVTFDGALEAFEWLAGAIKQSARPSVGQVLAIDTSSVAAGGNKLHHLADSWLPKGLLKVLYA